MAKKAARSITFALNAVAMACFLESFTQKVDQEVITVTALCDTGPKTVTGNYDHSADLAGAFDGAAGAGDATLFGMIGSAGVVTDFGPTGAVAGANDPHYTSTQALSSYTITAANGAAVKYSANLKGAAALVRAVA